MNFKLLSPTPPPCLFTLHVSHLAVSSMYDDDVADMMMMMMLVIVTMNMMMLLQQMMTMLSL